MVFKHSQQNSILLATSILLSPVFSAGYSTTNNFVDPKDNNKDCDCYVLSSGQDSQTPQYFQYYRFYDFRGFADKPGQYVDTPPLVNDTQDAGSEPVWNAEILNSTSWNTDWSIQNWSKPATEEFPVRMVNSPANIFISQSDDDDSNNNGGNPFTWLTLRTSRLDDFQSAGEIENNQQNVKHCSMRMYARVTGSKGAVAGFFTFFDDDNESDIEILTNDPTDTVRYTNQPAVNKKSGDEIAAASKEVASLPPWDEWQTHRIDWLDKNSYWFLNGKQVAANTYSVPRKPSYVVMNMWSDGGSWSGNMSKGDSAELQIQWIEMTFNTSGPVGGPGGGTHDKRGKGLMEKRKAKGCETVCKIDGVKETGHPEVVSVNKSSASELAVSWGLLIVVGLASVAMGL
ncbi:glycoside hydrolase family 16 protein [Aaosphaeria arxii CBS 175.79]|uniref:Glycoside hydrolase family 16 protein n=1 Tax=Aaosphaeria arxii CBS 175.79 TaxID=1450172 RepID=A0A6A5Y2X4_9PLEO|nr:glycoside hydrolase family 16 protein [Aaosphaeria arxii CBS 175.79]KAF2018924.1 glycoside hydrolase family 16 protein [Aaosphaeria arxii CBS 175.79]